MWGRINRTGLGKGKKVCPGKGQIGWWSGQSNEITFPFLRAEDQQSVGFHAQSSQDYLSCQCHQLSKEKREGSFTEKYEKLVVSRPEDSSYSCTLSSLKVLAFSGFPNT